MMHARWYNLAKMIVKHTYLVPWDHLVVTLPVLNELTARSLREGSVLEDAEELTLVTRTVVMRRVRLPNGLETRIGLCPELGILCITPPRSQR